MTHNDNKICKNCEYFHKENNKIYGTCSHPSFISGDYPTAIDIISIININDNLDEVYDQDNNLFFVMGKYFGCIHFEEVHWPLHNEIENDEEK